VLEWASGEAAADFPAALALRQACRRLDQRDHHGGRGHTTQEELVIQSIVRAMLMAGVAAGLALGPVAAHAADLPAARVSAPAAVPQATIHGCPSGWFCFYKDAGFGGRRVQFSSCGLQNLTDFGFNDQASSWVNNTGSSVDVFKDVNGGGGRLWHEPAHSESSFVGSGANDKASSFRRNC
jgi:hypothetical protein